MARRSPSRGGHGAKALRGTLVLVAATWLAIACAPIEPRFTTDADGGTNEQGLRPLEGTRFARAWARPGVSFSQYDRVWLRYRDIRYLEPPRKSRDPIYSIGGDNYALPDGLRDRFSDSMREIFRDELAGRGRWAADAGGEGVLDTRVALVDLILHTPLDNRGGNDDHYVDSIGAVTIVIDLHDSETGELVLRVAERGPIASQSQRPIQAAPGAAIYETRRLLDQWAKKLRRLLYALRKTDLPA